MLRRLRRDEGGFSLIEGVVSLGLMAVVLSLLMQNLVGGSAVILMSQQRQAATGLANEVLEQVRSVDFDAVTMATGDLSGDPLVAGASGSHTFRGRPVVAGPTAAAPFDPHVVTTTPAATPTSYSRAVYVTEAPSDPAAKLVTVRVTWDSLQPGGAAPLVELETVVTDFGCQTGSSTRPCEAYWFASAIAEPVTARVHGALLGQPVDVRTTLADSRAQLQTEQLSTVRSSAAAPTIAGSSGAGASTGPSTTADDDIASPAPVTDGPASTTQAIAPTPATTTRTGPSGGQATVTATAAASSVSRALASAEAGGDLMGGTVVPSHGLPHGRATSSPNRAAATAFSFAVPGVTGSADLFSVTASTGSADGVAVANRHPGSNPAIADDDAVEASASRALGAVAVGGLPVAARPSAAFTGVVRVTESSSGTVGAAAGPAAPAVAAPVPTGTLQVWNGGGYSNVAPGQTQAVAFSHTSGICTYDVHGTVSARAIVVPTPAAGGNVTDRSLTVTAPMRGSLTYRVTCGATVVADLTLDVDLGATTAQARFSQPGTP